MAVEDKVNFDKKINGNTCKFIQIQEVASLSCAHLEISLRIWGL